MRRGKLLCRFALLAVSAWPGETAIGHAGLCTTFAGLCHFHCSHQCGGCLHGFGPQCHVCFFFAAKVGLFLFGFVWSFSVETSSSTFIQSLGASSMALTNRML